MSSRRKSKSSKSPRIDDGASSNKRARTKVESETRKATALALPKSRLPSPNQLGRAFFNQDCEKLAQAMLGKLLVKILDDGTRLSGVIVETEAYLGATDPCCNTYGGRKTDHNAPMFEQPGTCFVYMTYGMYHCINIVSAGNGAAVLLRALEPREGIVAMQRKREQVRLARQLRRQGNGSKSDADKKLKKKLAQSTDAPESTSSETAESNLTSRFKVTDLCNGPSKLCESFSITREVHNRMDVCASASLFLETTTFGQFDLVKTSRIGLRGPAAEWPLRFYVKGSQFVSKT